MKREADLSVGRLLLDFIHVGKTHIMYCPNWDTFEKEMGGSMKIYWLRQEA